ncbi:TetR/AcrR family transcriptional regulator [Streptomyces sp. NPDC056944]|uniref:TetR/AcrR family transcriptional regulator n=1 Tax=Streptomyces sp. NPDC056944 TaxID=3345972 RepID=UPI00363DA941
MSSDKATAQAARRGRPTGDHTAKREALLKAAASVIAEEGYGNASLRKVAQRAGYTTGAVTYYFANKEELVTALAESRFDAYDAMLRAHGPSADMKALFEEWLATAASDPEFWPVVSQLLMHARYEPAFAALIERRNARTRAIHTSIVAAGQARGTVRDDIPADLLADHLAATADGWMMMIPFESERFTPSRLRALVDATMTLISPASGSRRPAESTAAGDTP